MDDSATVNTGRIATGAPLTLRAGTLSLATSTGNNTNSGEVLGTVTIGAGWNRMILLNNPAGTVWGGR